MYKITICLFSFFIFSLLGADCAKSHCFEDTKLSEIAQQYGTPLYVYSESRIRENYRRIKQAFLSNYPYCTVYYAVKANSNPAIVQILRDEGAGFDCSCLEEVMLVKKLGVQNEKIIFTGAYVPKATINRLLEDKIQVNYDCLSALDNLPAGQLPDIVSFRINPGIGSGGTEGLVFSGENAKFGISEALIEQAYARAAALGAKRFGAHMMTGSNILDPCYFPQIVEALLDIIGPISVKLGITFEYLDLGGSFGIPYHPEETPLDIEQVATEVVAVLKRKLLQYDMGSPKIVFEPGRYLVGDAGVLLTQVTSIKEETQKFIGVDAGINTLYFLEGAYRHISLAGGQHLRHENPVTVVGPLCTNKDVLGRSIPLPVSIKVDDILCIHDTGAYGFCKTSQFNTRPRCAEVLVSKGKTFLIREAETFGDLFEKTVMPAHLQPE